MEMLYVSRYDRHSLDKLIGSTTEARLIEEGHVFTLTDGRVYERDGLVVSISDAVAEPKQEEPEFLDRDEPRENL
jgi:hypothetical protein